MWPGVDTANEVRAGALASDRSLAESCRDKRWVCTGFTE